MKTLNNILSKIPGNGKKTLIGALLVSLRFAFPDFPLGDEELAKLAETFGYLYFIVGLLHKWVKARS